MQINSIFFTFLMIICAFLILFTMKKSNRFFSCAFLTIVQGISALFAVNLVTSITGVELAINSFSIAVSSIGGVFGVIMLLLSRVVLFM